MEKLFQAVYGGILYGFDLWADGHRIDPDLGLAAHVEHGHGRRYMWSAVI